MPNLSATIDGYGYVSVPSGDFDRAMVTYLPASPASLRSICQERSGLETGFADVLDVSVFLLVLADFDRTDGQ